MTDLEKFRDHCRRMSARPTQANIHLDDEQRAMFQRLADEADAYLTRNEDQPLDLNGA